VSIIGVPRKQKDDTQTSDVRRKHGIGLAMFCLWKAKFGGLKVSEARRLHMHDAENAQRKKLSVETILDNAALKDMTSKQ
jgi:putative transposase